MKTNFKDMKQRLSKTYERGLEKGFRAGYKKGYKIGKEDSLEKVEYYIYKLLHKNKVIFGYKK